MIRDRVNRLVPLIITLALILLGAALVDALPPVVLRNASLEC